MDNLKALLTNAVLIYGVLAWFTAQMLKIVLTYVRERRLDLSLFWSAGGMPSSHSAFVCAMSVAIALREGLGSPLFALAVGMAVIVMYDAAGVRRAAGNQAIVLNKMIEELFQGHPMSDEELKEILGHTPTQVFFGAVLGVTMTWIGMTLVWRGA